MKQAIKREIVAWRIFHTHNTFNNIAIVLFRTMNGQLRATIGLSDSFNKVSALQIANNGERLLFEEACPFFKHLVEENLRVSQVQIGSQAKGSRGGCA